MDIDGAVGGRGEVDRVTFVMYEGGPVGIVSTHTFVVSATVVSSLVEAFGGFGGSGFERLGNCDLD